MEEWSREFGHATLASNYAFFSILAGVLESRYSSAQVGLFLKQSRYSPGSNVSCQNWPLLYKGVAGLGHFYKASRLDCVVI